MSDPVTALAGASFAGVITVEDAGLTGMITLRADLQDKAVSKAFKDLGRKLPGQGGISGGHTDGTLWMSPDEVLMLCAHGEADTMASTLNDALSGTNAMAVNVSDARCVIRLAGSGAAIREVLAKLSPADLRPTALPPGHVRRTRLAQVPAAFWFSNEDEAYVIAFRSVGEYVFKLLSKASEEGSAVGHF